MTEDEFVTNLSRSYYSKFLPNPGRFLLFFAIGAPLCAADNPSAEFPAWHHGALTVKPSGYLDVVGMSRSATTPDSISTHFGNIPLTDTPGESVASLAHSRVMLKSDYDFASGTGRFTTYIEADFLNPQINSAPWRWRQYWASFRMGRWELLGGQGWSLLRENRLGIRSDRDLMNTLVIDPAYHVGIAGARRRQGRATYRTGRQTAAVAWENNGDFEGKWALDGAPGHLETAVLAGHRGRRALQISGVIRLGDRFRAVTQQYLARRALNEALSLVANGISGLATLEGVEWQATKKLEWYWYAGLVRGERSAGNRLVQQYTSGCNWRSPAPSLRGTVTLSLQYSYVERGLWDGRSGGMHFLMYRLRFAIP